MYTWVRNMSPETTKTKIEKAASNADLVLRGMKNDDHTPLTLDQRTYYITNKILSFYYLRCGDFPTRKDLEEVRNTLPWCESERVVASTSAAYALLTADVENLFIPTHRMFQSLAYTAGASLRLERREGLSVLDYHTLIFTHSTLNFFQTFIPDASKFQGNVWLQPMNQRLQNFANKVVKRDVQSETAIAPIAEIAWKKLRRNLQAIQEAQGGRLNASVQPFPRETVESIIESYLVFTLPQVKS